MKDRFIKAMLLIIILSILVIVYVNQQSINKTQKVNLEREKLNRPLSRKQGGQQYEGQQGGQQYEGQQGGQQYEGQQGGQQ